MLATGGIPCLAIIGIGWPIMGLATCWPVPTLGMMPILPPLAPIPPPAIPPMPPMPMPGIPPMFGLIMACCCCCCCCWGHLGWVRMWVWAKNLAGCCCCMLGCCIRNPPSPICCIPPTIACIRIPTTLWLCCEARWVFLSSFLCARAT